MPNSEVSEIAAALKEHVEDDHFYLKTDIQKLEKRMSEYSDSYSKIESLQTALDRASERIAALERIVIGGYE